MQIFLVLSLFVAVAFAGVGRLSIQQEDDVIALYRSICSNQRESGSNGGTNVYCKFPLDAPQEIQREHEIRADSPGTTSSQVVFVRPQSNIYRHQILLTGTSQHNRDTTIYVLPQKDQHDIAVKDQRVELTKGDKPHLYYLTRDPLGNDEIRQEAGTTGVGLSRSPARRPSSLRREFNDEIPHQDTVLVTKSH